jgi:hypothetical protein
VREDEPLSFFVYDVPLRVRVTGPLFQYVGIPDSNSMARKRISKRTGAPPVDHSAASHHEQDTTIAEAARRNEISVDNTVEHEQAHPASDDDFAVVAVLAALANRMDVTGYALRPLWPSVLHSFSHFTAPSSAAEALNVISIPLLMRLLRSPMPRHQEAGARCVRVLLSRRDSPPVNDPAVASITPLLVQLLSRSKGDGMLNVRREVVSTIADCLCPLSSCSVSLAAVAIPILVETTRDPDDLVVLHALCALAFISYRGREYISVMCDGGVLPAIIRHLPSPFRMIPALRCLSSILNGDDDHAALAIKHGAITALCAILRSAPTNLQRSSKKEILEAFWCLAARGAPQINALLRADVFDLIADDVRNDDEELRNVVQWTVAKALRGASEADRAAVIESTFPALLTAASTRRVGFGGIAGIEFVLNHCSAGVDIDVGEGELEAIMDALCGDIGAEAQHYIMERTAWLRRVKGSYT